MMTKKTHAYKRTSMKKQQNNSSHSNTHCVRVNIEFFHSTATAVAIAGTFNDWRPEATGMVSLGDGKWGKVLMLSPGDYEYLIVADGQWLPDPSASEMMPNPFGSFNSVLHVGKIASKRNATCLALEKRPR